MHALGPVENGKKYSSSLPDSGPSHLSGSNFSGWSKILSSFIRPQVGMLTMACVYVSASPLEFCFEKAQPTPPGMNVPTTTLPPGGVTLSRPVELVGRTRMTSRMTALRKGMLTRSRFEGTQSASVFPGKTVLTSSTSRCWIASSRAMKSKMFVIVLLVVSLPPTMELMDYAIISASVSGSLAFSFLPASR